MKKILLYVSFLAVLFTASCKKQDPPAANAKKEVEFRITYNATFSQYNMIMTLHATSIDGGLTSGFAFNGISSTPIVGMIHEASIMHTATFAAIPAATQSFRTSEPVSTLGVFLTSTPIPGETTPLAVTLDFYVDGKKTATGNATFIGPVTKVSGFVLDVTDPGKLIETNEIGG